MIDNGDNIPSDTDNFMDSFSQKTSVAEEEENIEKEVMRSEDNSAVQEDNSKWDGSQSEFVENDDAQDYEEQYAGIKLSYILKKDEIISCLEHSGMYKFNNARSIVEVCLLLILTILFLVMFFLTKNTLNLILGAISLFFAAFIVVLPKFLVHFAARKLTTGKKLSVEIYPDEIQVDSGVVQWKIPFDGSSSFEEFENMFLLYLPKEKLFIIPVRAIEPDFLADVQAMIIAGTSPIDEEE